MRVGVHSVAGFFSFSAKRFQRGVGIHMRVRVSVCVFSSGRGNVQQLSAQAA